jgi:hypothetical protein
MVLKKIANKVIDKASKVDKQKVQDKAKQVLAPKLSPISNIADFKKYTLTTLFYGGAAWASWRFIIKPYLQKQNKQSENNKVLQSPASRQASLLHQALDVWFREDKTTIFNIAHQIKDWSAVQAAYRNYASGRDINDDLKDKMSSEDYRKFITIVNHNLKANQTTSKKGFIVVSKKAIRLRSTPDSTISAWSFNSNILDTIQAGHFLGFATGVYKTDNEGVLYYQVRIKYTKGIPPHHRKSYEKLKNKILTFWVGAGAIDLIRDWKSLRASYPHVKLYKGTKDTGLRQALK